MTKLKNRFMLPVLSSLMAMSCMSGMEEKPICRNSFTERKPKEPHADLGAIPKPYRKKDKLTRKERKARYEKK